MKLKPIRNLNKVASLPNISTFRPKLKKDFNTNNISSTTNASRLNSYNNSSIIDSKNRKLNPKKVLLHKIRINDNKSKHIKYRKYSIKRKNKES